MSLFHTQIEMGLRLEGMTPLLPPPPRVGPSAPSRTTAQTVRAPPPRVASWLSPREGIAPPPQPQPGLLNVVYESFYFH